MYEERKKIGFKSPKEEIQYFVYLNMVEDDESFSKFKEKCSNSDPEIRAVILKDLFLCSLLSRKRIQETFEFIEKRLRDDVEINYYFFHFMFKDYNINNIILKRYQKEESFREAFKTFIENTKPKDIWFHRGFLNILFGALANNEVLIEDLIQWIFGLSNVKDFVEIYNETIKTKVSVEKDFAIIDRLLKLIRRPEKHQHVKDLLEKTLDKSVLSEKVKKLIEYNASFLSYPVIQRLLLSRSSTIERDFIFKYLDNKVLRMSDFENLSEFKESIYDVITFLPTAIQQLRLQEYTSSEITSRLLNTYKQLLIECGRCRGPDIMEAGNNYLTGGISFCNSIIKLMRKVLIEKEEMNNFVQFLDNEFLSKIEIGEEEEEKENVEGEDETYKIEFNVDDFITFLLLEE